MTQSSPLTLNDHLMLELKRIRKMQGLGLRSITAKFITLSEFEELKHKNLLPDNLFTEEELAYCRGRLPSLCGRYAVKLAIRQLHAKKIPWQNINISFLSGSQPIVKNMKDIIISITHEHKLVIAVAASIIKNHTISIGVDLAKISRFKNITKYHPGLFVKIFTKNELVQIKNKKSDPATIWSIKEAVSKALGIGIWGGSRLLEMNAWYKNGKYHLVLKGQTLKQSINLGYAKWYILTIKDKNYALTLAIASDK